MRTLIITALLIVFPLSALAATETEAEKRARRAAIDTMTMETECKKELGFTDAQLKRGTFIEMLRKCITQKVNVVEQMQMEEALKNERASFINKATESYQKRFRTTTKQPVRVTTPVVRRTAVKRVSTRVRRADAMSASSSSAAASATSSATPK